MAKIHAVIIDAEVENEETIRSLLSAIRGTPDPAAIATPAVELEEPRKLLPAVRPKPVKTANPIKHESEPRGNMTIGNSIVAALKKRALSSLELIELLKLTPQTVYSTCSTLKSKGVIEGRIEGDDETRRWYVK